LLYKLSSPTTTMYDPFVTNVKALHAKMCATFFFNLFSSQFYHGLIWSPTYFIGCMLMFKLQCYSFYEQLKYCELFNYLTNHVCCVAFGTHGPTNFSFQMFFFLIQYIAHHRSKFYNIMPKNPSSHKRLFNSTKSMLPIYSKKLVWILLNFFDKIAHKTLAP
jgi:hypothetical protein